MTNGIYSFNDYLTDVPIYVHLYMINSYLTLLLFLLYEYYALVT